MKYIILGFVALLNTLDAYSIVEDTVYINRGSIEVTSQTIHRIAINSESVFNPENTVVDVPLDETLNLVVINNDNILHRPFIDGYTTPFDLAPEDTLVLNITADQLGTFSLLSDVATAQLLGASAMIRIGIDTPRFHWDLWEQEAESTQDIIDGVQNSIPFNYRPNTFTINGAPFSDDMMSSGNVTGMVNQEIYISITNSGNMTQNIHFHGYHVEIIQAVKRPEVVGWNKDSFPLLVKESMTVKLVPHQAGEFPVHNHNLVTNLTGNGYPGGMMTMLMIME